MSKPLPIVPLLVVAGCAPGGDFALHLAPIVADAQPDPAGKLTLVVDDASGRRLVPTADDHGDTWSTEALGALDAAVIGLVWADPGADVDPPAWASVHGWGRSAPLTLSEGDVTAPVLVGAPLRVGTFGRLAQHAAVLAPAAASLPDGDVLLFGGAALDPSPFADDPETETGVLRLSLADPDTGFVRVADVPVVGTERAARVDATATVLPDGRVLLAGGRGSWIPAETGTAVALLFDPATDDLSDTGALHRRRSGHAAFLRPDGRVLVLGGYGGGTTQLLDTESWDPADGRWDVGPTATEVGAIGFASVDLGERGVVACGGAVGGGGLLSAVAGCRLLRDDAEPLVLPPLPAGADGIPSRAFGAAAALDDHRVLLAGGVTGAVSASVSPATADAFVLDLDAPEAWRPVGPLALPRVLHRLVALPDGGVLVVGGAAEVTGVPPSPTGEPIACAERFDPTSETFRPVDPCEPAGAGPYVALSSAAGAGVFVLAGPGGDDGGRAWGLIPTGPAPTP